MKRVWLGVGSNLRNPKNQIDQAIYSLSKLPVTKLLSCSSYYQSQPLGDQDQPDFLNAVVILNTRLDPENFLNYLQIIERQQGRVRHSVYSRWGSRTLDLDILLFDKYIVSTDKLTIPHYDMLNREFVMYPLIELEHNLVLPNGVQIKNVIKFVPKKRLMLWVNNDVILE